MSATARALCGTDAPEGGEAQQRLERRRVGRECGAHGHDDPAWRAARSARPTFRAAQTGLTGNDDRGAAEAIGQVGQRLAGGPADGGGLRCGAVRRACVRAGTWLESAVTTANNVMTPPICMEPRPMCAEMTSGRSVSWRAP